MYGGIISNSFLAAFAFMAISTVTLRYILRWAPERMKPDPGFRIRFWAITYALLVVSMLASILLGYGFFEEVKWYTREDGLVEWSSFWLALAAAGFFAADVWRARGEQPRRLSLFLCLLCVVIAGEEISWGQRVLNFESPTFFADHNLQDETTLHNLQIGSFRLQNNAQILVPPAIFLLFALAQTLFPRLTFALSGERLTWPVFGFAMLFSAFFILSSYPYAAEEVHANLPLHTVFGEYFHRHSSPQSEASEMMFSGLLLVLAVAFFMRSGQRAGVRAPG